MAERDRNVFFWIIIVFLSEFSLQLFLTSFSFNFYVCKLKSLFIQNFIASTCCVHELFKFLGIKACFLILSRIGMVDRFSLVLIAFNL